MVHGIKESSLSISQHDSQNFIISALEPKFSKFCFCLKICKNNIGGGQQCRIGPSMPINDRKLRKTPNPGTSARICAWELKIM